MHARPLLEAEVEAKPRPERPRASQQPAVAVLIGVDPGERARLVAGLPVDMPVLLVATPEQAQQVLGAGSPPPRPVPRPVDRPVRQGVAGMQLLDDRRAMRSTTGEAALTSLEFRLLRCLLDEPGRVCTFDRLSERVWGTTHLGDASQVHAVVKRLRRKLVDVEAPVTIEAVRGVGFRLVPSRPTLVAADG